MRPIPIKLRAEMADDPFYTCCCLCGNYEEVQWHHVWIYGGRQINEKWAVVPACKKCHELVAGDKYTRQYFEKVSLLRTIEADLKKYYKKDWQRIKINLGL